jgi:DHA1 family inner membrane transport protein
MEQDDGDKYSAGSAESGKTNLALATLFLGMFVLGSGELLVVSLLNLIAADLLVSIPTASWGTPRASMQYRVVSLAGPDGQLASSLPASAANVGIALGANAGGVAIGTFPASSAVITGLIIAVISTPIAWPPAS